MAGWLSAGQEAELAPGQVRVVQAGRSRLAVCNVDGKLFCIDDVCTRPLDSATPVDRWHRPDGWDDLLTGLSRGQRRMRVLFLGRFLMVLAIRSAGISFSRPIPTLYLRSPDASWRITRLNLSTSHEPGSLVHAWKSCRCQRGKPNAKINVECAHICIILPSPDRRPPPV